MRTRFLACLTVLAMWVASGTARAEEVVDVARLAPETALVWLEIGDPAVIFDRLFDPALYERASQTDQMKTYLASEQYRQFQTVVRIVEGRLGVEWQPGLRELLGGGVHVSYDPAQEAVLVAVRSKRPELLTALHEAINELITSTSQIAGQPSPAKSQEYKGRTGWSFAPQEAHVILGDVLLISNKADALKGAIDRLDDPALRSLADVTEFQQARALHSGQTGWGFARLDALRQLPNVQAALNAKSDNPVGEFLVAGVLDAFKYAPSVTAGLKMESDRAALSFRLPRDPAQVSSSRTWFFAPTPGQAPAPLVVPGAIGSMTVYRDLSGLWAARDELFNEAIAAQFAQVDASFGLFFSGRDFGPEVLGEVDPRMQLVVAGQTFDGQGPTPAIRLPAEALVGELHNAEEFYPQLLAAYQTFVGAINLGNAQNGQPRMLLGAEVHRGVEISTATFLPDPGASQTDAPLQFNFSPSFARSGNRFIFGSTVGIVRSCIEALEAPGAAAPTADNFLLQVDAAAVATALDANRDLLISQNMLSEGLTLEQAGERFTALLDIVRLLGQGTIRLAEDPQSVTLELSLGAAR